MTNTVLPFGKKERPFLGRAVLNGKIRYSSVSQITQFLSCPRKWAYPYSFQQKLVKTPAQLKGSDEFAPALEHYLKSGEDILPPVLQPAKRFFPVPGPDLEVEQPLGDIVKAIGMRDAQIAGVPGSWSDLLTDEMRKFAGLTACGIPLDGAADVRHRRGEYIDEQGELRREHPATVVANIDDLKTVSRLVPQPIRNGPNAGTILPAYLKTNAQVCEDIQMDGYGVHAGFRYPEITHVRLNHVYASTGTKGAVKRGGLISVEQVRERWHLGAETAMAQMIDTAGASKIEDVPYNLEACDSYTHVGPDGKTAKGCGYKYVCPRSNAAINIFGNQKESGMSLFDQAPVSSPTPPAPPAPPPLNGAAYDAAVAAERAKLEATMRAQPPLIGVDGYVVGQGCNGHGYYANRNGQGFIPVEAGHVCRPGVCAGPVVAPPVPPPLPFNPAAVTPPDAPVPSFVQSADPMPPEEIAQIGDPVARARAEEHARQHAALAAQQAAAAPEEKTVWCAGSKLRIELTMEMALARKFTCQCSKVIGLKPAKEGDKYFATIPRHKPLKPATSTVEGDEEAEEEESTAPMPPAPPAPPVNGNYTAPGALAGQTVMPTVLSSPPIVMTPVVLPPAQPIVMTPPVVFPPPVIPIEMQQGDFESRIRRQEGEIALLTHRVTELEKVIVGLRALFGGALGVK